MSIYHISLGLVILFNLFLGIFVLSRNVGSKINRIFCLYASSLVVRGFGMLLISLVPENQKDLALKCVPIIHLGLVFIPSTFFHFVLALTGDDRKFNRRVFQIGYLFSFFFLFIDRLGLLVSGVTFTFGTYKVIGGPIAPFLSLFFLILASYGIYLLYRAYKTSISPLEKNQYKYFFFGMIVALLLSLTNFMRVMGIRIHPLDH
ncbi:hypothetical protein KJ693_11250, partial [bacterium]|nr:hypothetical protein [bacterium]MBU1615866.1 hypothetical protein [bacterium]